jgi:general secretion pathway protein M
VNLRATLQPALAAWARLAPRERGWLLFLGAFLALLAVYFALWSPLHRGLDRMRVQVPRAQQQLAEMRELAGMVARLRAGGVAAPLANPVSAVEQAMGRHGLRATRIEADGPRGVRLQLDGVPYPNLMACLIELQAQHGVRAETATLAAHAAPGAVTARLLLRAPGT